MSKRQLGAAVAGTIAATALAALAPTTTASASTQDATWQITSNLPTGVTGPLTLNLTPVSLRGPDFKVLEQDTLGNFTDITATLPAEHDYLGTVAGRTDAMVAATKMSDGTWQGEVVVDRGITWFFSGNAITNVRGTSAPTYKWPIRQPMTSDLIGSGQVRDEVGWDIDSALFTGAAPNGFAGDPAKAIDMAELSMNEMRAPYIQDVGITPVLGTVILRGSSTTDPYASVAASAGAYLGKVGTVWDQQHPWLASGTYPDNQVQVISSRFGGGVAYVPGHTSAVGGNASGGWAVVARHEAAHNWGVNDENGGDPEGPTIQSGNAYARWDSTEVNAINSGRKSAVGNPARVLGTYANTFIPPYAATDYVEAVAYGPAVTFNPLGADHSANGEPLDLKSVQSTSALGSKVIKSGNTITYIPSIAPTAAIDTFTYVVEDADGMTATGLVMVKNLAPFQKAEAEAGTLTNGSWVKTDGWDHSGAGYVHLPNNGSAATWTINQTVPGADTLTFWTYNAIADNATVTIDGQAPIPLSLPVRTAGPEGEGSVWTPVSTTVNLSEGPHTITYTDAGAAQSLDYMTASWSNATPTAPRSLHLSNGARGGALTTVATWAAPTVATPAVTSYEVRIQSKSPTGAYSRYRYVTVSGGTHSLSISGARGYLYRVQVIARNRLGTGPWTGWSNFAYPR